MPQPKKILSALIKLAIGLGSFFVIWYRLRNDLSPDKLHLLVDSAGTWRGMTALLLCLLLIPVNWGIEAWKWQLITAPIEKISYAQATRSVYSGVCVGNLAPGRATEFLGKIIFFRPSNRAQITVIHFLNGMFQLSVTLLSGLVALFLRLQSFGDEYIVIARLAAGLSIALLAFFVVCLFRVEWILNLAAQKVQRDKNATNFSYQLSHGLMIRIFALSVLRFSVFFGQMLLLIALFHPMQPDGALLVSVALYFLLTTVIPMFSLIEAAVRAAIALVVFRDSGIPASALALSSILLWVVNIIVPSAGGYVVLLKQKFDFKLKRPNV